MKFFDTLNGYLRSAAKNSGEECEAMFNKMQKLQDELDERVTREKAGIEERLEEELSSIEPTDLKTRTRIWEEYYDALDEMGERYDKKLEEILSNAKTPSA